MSSRTLVQGGCVLTLGARTANLPEGDVLIEDGRVAEVGPRLRARDAEVVDASGTIVMPGLVDTHRHAWRTLLRSSTLSGDGTGVEAYGRHHGPDDVYAATLLGLLGALETGTTTVVDWADVDPDERSTEAALEAHRDAGVRTVLVHARPSWAERGPAAAQTLRAAAARELPPMTTVAYGSPDPTTETLDALERAWSLARELGLRIHVHAGTRPEDRGVLAALAERRLLAGDVTIVHGSLLDDRDLDALAASGAALSLAPSSEMARGLRPPLQELLDRGIRPGLAVDDETASPGDLFAQMRAVQSLQHATHFDRKLAGKGGLPNLLTTREVIRYATSDGARVAGLAEATGSLEPGRQADILVLRTDRPNVFPVNDPIGAVVWAMDPSNVDWVFVGGVPRVRHGVLDADVEHVRRLALAARTRVAGAAGQLMDSGVGGSS